MQLDTTKTVRELAVEMPGATRVFEKLKIDYCCGGGKSLESACAVAGVKVDEITRLLGELDHAELYGSELSDSATDFQSVSLAALMTYIINKHHVFTTEEMARLRALMAKVCAAHGENHAELFSINTSFQKLCAELEPHMMKEERILFPYIVSMEEALSNNAAPPMSPFGTVRNPVRIMMLEHDAAGDILREMRELSHDYAIPPDVCISYRTLYQALEAFEQDLHQHIHLENNLLFPRALEMENTLAAKSC